MRSTAEEIAARRENRSGKILLTGATGFIGSFLATSLIRDGFPLLLLSRQRNGSSARERVERVLRWHGLSIPERIGVIEGDLTQPCMGLAPDAFLRLAREVREIVHCASHTNFEESRRREIYETNLGGTATLLDLAECGSCDAIHYLSTAYVAGKGGIVCRELWQAGNGFHNPYESSKHEAEGRLVERCGRAGIRLWIYRPSIVVGDSTAGRTMLFNAMYFPVKVAWYLAEGFRKDIAEEGGELAARMGVRREPDGTLHMPLRIDRGPCEGGVINLVPIDFVIDAVRAIMRRAPGGGIFHIVNPRPCTLEDLIAFSQRYFRLSGVGACPSDAFCSVPKTGLERRFDQFVRIYLPYMSDQRRFDSTETDAVLAGTGLRCPEIDYELFRRLTAYGVACGWRSPQESL